MRPGRVEAAGGPLTPVEAACSPHPAPCALHPAPHIFSLSEIASLEGGVEEVLSSSFAPSHGVFTALWLSLSTWFPGRAFCSASTLTAVTCQVPRPPGRQRASLSRPLLPAVSYLGPHHSLLSLAQK